MPIAAAYLQEFETESVSMRKCLERIPDDKLGWQPHGKSMTLGQLATHIARVPAFMTRICLEGGLDFGDAPREFTSLGTTAEVLELWDGSAAYVREHLPTLDDAAMAEMWSFRRNGEAVFSFPRAAMLRRMLLNHLIHHRGQLSVYLRLLDIPVPSIYGPSADENPFN